MLRDYIEIKINTNNTFVGVKIEEKRKPTIYFPYGYLLSFDNDEKLRNDIISLLSVIRRFSDRNDGDYTEGEDSIQNYPLESYFYIIKNFLENGYYVEKEGKYKTDNKGKINWKRTISYEKSTLDNNNIIYLNFKVKDTRTNENNILSKIHKMCVYKSFYLFGWLYLEDNYIPKKPNELIEKNEALSVLRTALSNTFNDDKKRLFKSMINIIESNKDESVNNRNYIGVNNFDHVWEKIVDYVFGESNKDMYFPHATWHIIKDNATKKTSALIPDTIMKYDNKIFVLDSKYYRYGINEDNYSLLPQSDSIQKQITYGKYISSHIKDILPYDNINENSIFNAFIMPYCSNNDEHFKFVSIATSDWEKYNEKSTNYLYVVGLLLDTKYIINEYTKHNDNDIKELSKLIIKSLDNNKKIVFSNL